jgi:hypothetical protein
MQMPSVDRSLNLRPASADLVVSAATRVVPVAPVNPSVQAASAVVNEISPELQAKIQQKEAAVLQSAPDPLKGGSAGDAVQKDWTERKPAPEKAVEAPPKESISKMLLDHIHSLWAASARAVEASLMTNQSSNQTQQRVQSLNQTRSQDPLAVPGIVAREDLTYTPSKIKKTEKS